MELREQRMARRIAAWATIGAGVILLGAVIWYAVTIPVYLEWTIEGLGICLAVCWFATALALCGCAVLCVDAWKEERNDDRR